MTTKITLLRWLRQNITSRLSVMICHICKYFSHKGILTKKVYTRSNHFSTSLVSCMSCNWFQSAKSEYEEWDFKTATQWKSFSEKQLKFGSVPHTKHHMTWNIAHVIWTNFWSTLDTIRWYWIEKEQHEHSHEQAQMCLLSFENWETGKSSTVSL